ncbi:MAG: 50S ribosomal protein L4 [Nanoarchaeota archaeon]|nr:50S ribosomal protein L4 [Nanoarchaeota archaeon]MBU4123870.1 50S ribosomal protein L4 [Nanoarchaeota archaeon]
MTKIFDLNGNAKGEIKLPKVFSTPYRPDLITRVVLALRSHRRQPYGPDPLAGQRTSAHYHGVRKGPHHMMNREMARNKRSHGGSSQQEMRARASPHAVSGRKCHPPMIDKVWDQKINKKENILAIKSALAAVCNSELVSKKYRMELEAPIIITDDIQKVNKTKDLEKIIELLKILPIVERAKDTKIRPGKGKMRGRRYKNKKSVLFIVANDSGIVKAAKNIAGADICNVKNINVELLAPGTHAGRITIFDEASIKSLGELYG